MANNNAKKFAGSLAKKYLFKEDIYQTDVLFSSNGDKMFINGADINKNTKIYEYTTKNPYTSLHATQVDISLTPFTHDISYTDSTITSPFPFISLQNAFAFQQGVSDMYQFAIHLRDDTVLNGTQAYIAIDASREAIKISGKPHAYKQGVSYFCTFTDDDDQTGAKSALVASAAESYTKHTDIPSQIQQQFCRLFFDNDGKKLFALYRNKEKTNAIPGYAYAIKQYTLPEAFKLENATLTDLSSTTDILVYDLSAKFDHTNSNYPINGGGTYENMGMYSSVSDNSLRDITGFHFSSDGKKVFFLANRGKSKNEDNAYMGIFDKDHYFFGEVSEFSLATAWDITSTTTHKKTARFYGNQYSTTSAQSIGIYPIDIDFNYNGTKLNILGSEGKEQYLYTHNLSPAYTLPDKLDNENFYSKTKINDHLLVSLSSINNPKTTYLRNIAGSGVGKGLARQCKDASVEKGNTLTINSTNLLSTELKTIIANKQLTSVIEHEISKAKPKANHFYAYDPTKSTIMVNGNNGNDVIPIIELKPGVSTINVGGQTLTFVGMVEKEVNGETYYALVFTSDYNNPSPAVVPLEVNLDNQGEDVINSQPLNGEIQALLADN